MRNGKYCPMYDLLLLLRIPQDGGNQKGGELCWSAMW